MTKPIADSQRTNSTDHESTRSRFVVLQHDVGTQLIRTTESHCDWMFELGGVLRTWATPLIERFDKPIESACDLLQDHRLRYLDYEGEIRGHRGSITRLLQGDFHLIDSADGQFVAELSWQQDEQIGVATAWFYRSLPESGLRRDDSCGFWRFRFSPGRYETNR